MTARSPSAWTQRTQTMIPITPEYLRPRLLHRDNDSHKHDYGRLLIVAGCETMPGAAILSTGAAALGVWIHGMAGDVLTAEKSAEAYDSEELIGKLECGFRQLYRKKNL